jgi:hypothetical protein
MHTAASDRPRLTSQVAVQFLVRAWGQVSTQVLDRTWRIYEPDDDPEQTTWDSNLEEQARTESGCFTPKSRSLCPANSIDQGRGARFFETRRLHW